MIRAIKSGPKVGDIMELRQECLGSKWRMEIVCLTGDFFSGGFHGKLISSTYDGDKENIGRIYEYEPLSSYIRIET